MDVQSFFAKIFHPIFRNPGFWCFTHFESSPRWDGFEKPKNPPFRTPLGFLLNNWSLVPGTFQGVALVVEKAVRDFVFEAQKHLDFRHQTLQFLPPQKKWKTLEISLICNGIYNDRFEHKRESKCQIFSNNFEIDFDFFLRISWLSPEALCEIMGPSKESQLRFNNDAINNAQQQKSPW